MLIVSGKLYVDPDARQAYLRGCRGVVEQARSAPGCLDFALSADPLEPGRINVYERWASDEELAEFRGSGPSSEQLAEIRDASVHKYRISAVEDPYGVAVRCYTRGVGESIAQRDLRNDVSSILRRVAEGESFTVTVRGEPVAEIVPIRRPRRFVPRRRLAEILAASSADLELLAELREMDVDDQPDPWDHGRP